LSLKVYSAGDSSRINSLITLINDSYNISLLLLLPPVLIIILSFFKVSISISLCVGLLSGAVLGLIFQEITVQEILKCSIFGYRNDLSPVLSNIFKGGGIRSMMDLLAILITASSFSGLLSWTRILHSLLENTVQKLKSGSQLVLYTIMLSTITAILGCNQIVSIIIPSQFLLSSYKRFNISKLVLARAISDSGIMVSPIIPWNVCAIVPAAIMGVPVIQFAPYSFLCFILPLANIISAYMRPCKTEEAVEQ
jgi:NhaC family Na+:H+ antiporter